MIEININGRKQQGSLLSHSRSGEMAQSVNSLLLDAGVWTSKVGSIQKKIYSSAYLQFLCWEAETGEASVGKWWASFKWVILFQKEKTNWERHLTLIPDLRVSHIHTGSVQNSLSHTHKHTYAHAICTRTHAGLHTCMHTSHPFSEYKSKTIFINN